MASVPEKGEEAAAAATAATAATTATTAGEPAAATAPEEAKPEPSTPSPAADAPEATLEPATTGDASERPSSALTMAARPSPDEVMQIRALLGRLQTQITKEEEAKATTASAEKAASSGNSGDGDGGRTADVDVTVHLTKTEVELLGHLFGRGLLRAPSKQASSLRATRDVMSATQFTTTVAHVRGDKFWKVDIGYEDLSYTVNVPMSSVGIRTVGNQFSQLFAPITRTLRGLRSERLDLPILHPMSGAFKAGRSTLLLGPPGCGVTTFLKALAGRLRTNKTHTLGGKLLYSGFAPEEVNVRKFSSYVDQVDEHLPVLTVRETLKFANACTGGDSQLQELIDDGTDATPEELRQMQELMEKFPEYLMHNFALTNAADTIVGNDELRGVSGGERKRVTSTEMVITKRPLLLLDQISTGLDSAATFDICRRLTAVGVNLSNTVLAALLQPTPETYELFDEVMILARGHLVYHGKREDVLPYFASIGYVCPEWRDIADFIQEVTTDLRQRYLTTADAALAAAAPKDEAAMAAAWTASPFSEVKRQETVAFVDPGTKAPSKFMEKRYVKKAPLYALPRFTELRVVLARSKQVFLRDKAFIKARIGQAVVMGVIVGTVFFKVDGDIADGAGSGSATAVTQRYGLMFTGILQAMLTGMAAIPIVIEQRAVMYKQDSAFFYRIANYVVAEFLVSLPISIVESTILGTLIYWLSAMVPFGDLSTTGEDDAAGIFFIWLLLLIVINISFGSFLRFVAAASPNATIGQVVAGVSIAFCVLFSGFIISVNNIPDWAIWIYWLVPLSWALRTMVIAVFQSDTFTEAQSVFAIDLFGFQDDRLYIWVGIGVLAAYVLFNVCMTTLAYKYIRYDSSGGRQTVAPDGSTDDEDVVEAEQAEAERLSQRDLAATAAAADAADAASGAVAVDVPVPEDDGLSSASFQKVDLIFRDLFYSVPHPHSKGTIDLLKGISGYAAAGTMTALMGSSGAGKTTLMDVVAGRKTGGTIKGDILVNGRPKEAVSFSRIMGYVEQNDIHSPHATVEEALTFSALLRQPDDVPTDEKTAFVQATMRTLELVDIKDFEIGFKTSGGLSVEQAKRLTIGVELAANPSVLFLDEPTSGLDARAAVIVMRGIKRVAASGRTVVATIHQPSRDVFQQFDRLLLLRRGGEMVYAGDVATVVDYLQGIPGTKPIPNARYNPANYMLEVTGPTDGLVDYAHEYSVSELREGNEVAMDNLATTNLSDREEVHFDHEFAASLRTQQRELLKKWVLTYWRSPAYNFTRVLVNLFMALLFGFAFYDKGDVTNVSETQSLAGLIFLSTLFIGIINLNTVIPVIATERASFYRERSAHMYSVIPYVIANTLTEIPYNLLSTLVFMGPFYFIAGFYKDAATFWLFWFVFALFQGIMTFLGQMLAILLPNEQTATILAGASVGIMNLFGTLLSLAGFLIAVDDIPSFWTFMPAIDPVRYVFEALIIIQLECDDGPGSSSGPGCNMLDDANGTAWEVVQTNFGFESSQLWPNIGITIAFLFAFRIFTALGLAFVNHQKR